MTSSTTGLSPTPYNFPPNSPVSPRVTDIKEDMDVLTLSRMDSPYISSKLEQLSNSCGSSIVDSHDLMTLRQQMISPNSIAQYSTGGVNRSSVGDASQSLLWSDNEDANMESLDLKSSLDLLEEIDDGHLHDHLIRSPPPQFPTNISAFVFPEPGSPLHAVSTGVRSPVLKQRHPNIMKASSESAAMSDSVFEGPNPSLTKNPSDNNRPHVPRRPLVRRASAGGQDEHSIDCRCDPVSSSRLVCSKRASSGPNIIRTPGSTSTSNFHNDSQSREALINQS